METSPQRRRRVRPRGLRWTLPALAAVLVLGGAVIGYGAWNRGRALPFGLLQINGRIEGDTVMVGSKLAGRICALRAREGDTIRAGDVIAQLDDATAHARLAQATAAREVASAQADAARVQLALLRKKVPIAIASANLALSSSGAVLEQASAQEAQLGREARRTSQLRATGAVTEEVEERASLAHGTAVHSVTAARAARDRDQDALLDARLGPDQVRAQAAAVAALDAAVRQAQAAVDEAQAALSDLTVVAPVHGTITSRFVDAGEVVSPGTPLVEIVDLDRLYLKAFVPDADIGKIRLGVPARIFSDAFPDRPAPATVGYIASRAEFTPKEVQTRDERVKLVYAVKLYVGDNRELQLAPGLSADAIVRWREGVPWSTPR